ncbi:MAG: hypothetical protein R3B84_22525 [Zavarzinella sp.]
MTPLRKAVASAPFSQFLVKLNMGLRRTPVVRPGAEAPPLAGDEVGVVVGDS